MLVCVTLALLAAAGCGNPYLKHLNKLYAKPGGAVGKAGNLEAKCQVLMDWMGGLEREHPNIDTSSWYGTTSEGARYFAVIYQDDLFVPVFGQPYDREWGKKVDWRRQQWTEECWKPEKFAKAKQYDQWRWRREPLYVDGGLPGIREHVERARTLKKDMARELTSVKGQPATLNNYQALRKSYKRWEEAFTTFRPTDRVQFLQELTVQTNRMADAALAEKFANNRSLPPTYDNLVAFAQVARGDDPYLWDHASPAAVQRETARAQADIRKGLAPLLDEEWKRFQNRGTGLVGVMAGCQSAREFEERFGEKMFPGEVSIAEVKKRIVAVRESDIAANASDLARVVREAGTVKDLDAVSSQYFTEIDEGPKSENLKSLASARRERLYFNENHSWKFAAHEVTLMTTTLGTIDVPKTYGPPDNEEIRLALLRAFVDSGGTMVSPYVAKWGIALTTGTMRLADVTKNDCRPRPRDRYVCRYQVAQKLELEALGVTTGTLPIIDPWFIEDEFVLTDEGWKSPTAVGKIRQKGADLVATQMENLGRAAESMGCVPAPPFYLNCP